MEAELLTARDAFLDIFQWIDLFVVNIYLIPIIMSGTGEQRHCPADDHLEKRGALAC